MQHQPFNRKKQLGISVNSVDPKMIKIDILLGYTWNIKIIPRDISKYIHKEMLLGYTWMILDVHRSNPRHQKMCFCTRKIYMGF